MTWDFPSLTRTYVPCYTELREVNLESKLVAVPISAMDGSRMHSLKVFVLSNSAAFKFRADLLKATYAHSLAICFYMVTILGRYLFAAILSPLFYTRCEDIKPIESSTP